MWWGGWPVGDGGPLCSRSGELLHGALRLHFRPIPLACGAVPASRFQGRLTRAEPATPKGTAMKRLARLIALLGLASVAGCSTVSAVGGLLGGMGHDIEDMAQGAREQMFERRPQ